MPPEPIPTLVLLTDARRGDSSAREELFERIYPKLRKIVALRMGCRSSALSDCDDIIQNSIEDALRSIEGFEPRGEGSLLHWLARIVQNNLADAERYRSAQLRDEKRRVRLGDGTTVLTVSIFPDGSPTPSQDAQGHEAELIIEEAMLELEERERRVIELRLLCDFSFEEIAADLGLGVESSARALFSRARAALRVKLARKLDPSDGTG